MKTVKRQKKRQNKKKQKSTLSELQKFVARLTNVAAQQPIDQSDTLRRRKNAATNRMSAELQQQKKSTKSTE